MSECESSWLVETQYQVGACVDITPAHPAKNPRQPRFKAYPRAVILPVQWRLALHTHHQVAVVITCVGLMLGLPALSYADEGDVHPTAADLYQLGMQKFEAAQLEERPPDSTPRRSDATSAKPAA